MVCALDGAKGRRVDGNHAGMEDPRRPEKTLNEKTGAIQM